MPLMHGTTPEGAGVLEDVVIVGAGIAGLTLARALARRGLQCRVVEQADSFGEVGAGLQLSPNATRILRRLGLGDQLAEVAVRLEAVIVHDETGRVVHEMKLGAACEELYGAPYFAVHRARLHALLAQDLPVSLGDVVTGVSQRSDGARITLDSGVSSTHRLVIGADGVRSQVRSLVADDAPTYSGQSMFRALVPAKPTPWPTTPACVRVFAAPGQHCVSYPVGNGLVNVVATAPMADWVAESWSRTESPETLRAAYDGWAQPVVDLLSSITQTQRWAVFERPPLHHWSTASTTLVGDAAHPMLPFMAQGANQAIEDAISLAACLWSVPATPLETALNRYETARIARTTQIQERSRSNVSQARSTVDAPLPREALHAQEWLFGHDAELAACLQPDAAERQSA
jgi:salicylate hydroxylase